MIEPVLLDTGPIVALLHKRDSHHAECVAATKALNAEFITCWPVITEAAWMLRTRPRELQRLMEALYGGAYFLADLPKEAAKWIGEFLTRYKENRAQLADAALMYLAERIEVATVFTLDRRDFSVYRTRSGRALRILP